MAHNVEIKTHIRDVAALIECMATIMDSDPERIEQDDTFLACANGRLKLRQFSLERGELIHYFRANSAGPRVFNYHIVPTNTPGALRDTLAAAIGAAGRVMKVHQLYLAGQTRIHVDTVKNLGGFVELKVVLHEDQSEDGSVAIAHVLMQSLGIVESDLLDVTYVDLLAAQQH